MKVVNLVMLSFVFRLETKHGEVFVRSTLGYLTASKTGISASELLDVLSCDDVVLDDAFEFHIPPIRRLPPLLWTRLRLDLGKVFAFVYCDI